MSAAEGTAEGLTKSAKKRMNQKKAKDAAAAEAQAAEEAAAAAAAAEAAAAAAPKAKGKAKSKAEGAPKAAAAPAEPAAKGKAKAKGEPKAEPKAAASKSAAKATPKAEAQAEPKADAKAAAKSEPKAKAKGKAKAKAAAEEAPVKRLDEIPTSNTFEDDGMGGWETPAQLKKQKQKKEKDESKKADPESKKDEAKAATGGWEPRGDSRPKGGGKGGKNDGPQSAAIERVREHAQAEVARILAMKSDEPAAVAAVAAHHESIIVPEEKIGMCIGPKGQTIQLIQETSKVTRIDTAGGVFTISGDMEAVKEAKKYIQDVIDTGFCKLYYEEFTEGFVNAHPSTFPDIIGSRGAIINAIKNELKVEINIPKLPETYQEGQKFKIKIAGSAKQVEEAKEVIESLTKYQHHEITHPGMVHEELDIEQSCYSYIIGRGGSEMKHLQNSYHVKVNIPRDHSEIQKVLVVGLPDGVKHAKAHIEKTIENALTRQNSREKADNEDKQEKKWVDKDDEVEPGCEGYVYKR